MVALLMRSAPSEPPVTSTSCRPGSTPSAALAASPSRRRSISSTSGLIGLPVTTARGSGVPGNDTAAASREASDETVGGARDAFCSATTIGTRHSSGQRHGDRRVAADGDHDARAKAPDEDDGAAEGAQDADDGADVPDGQSALDAAAGQQRDREAGLRDEALLDATLASHEVDRRALMSSPDERPRDGEPGEHVPGGTTSRDDRKGLVRVVSHAS